MASSMIHLAATKCAVQTLAAGDWDRLWLGCVLPDGAAHGKIVPERIFAGVI